MHKRIEFTTNQTLLFIGDSITDCGRREFAYAPLGCGYVNFAANMLLASRPDLNLSIENRGIGGDSTRDLMDRWQEDCLDLNPDIVSIMIGINDLWRKYGDSIDSLERHVGPDEYEENYRFILKQLKKECDPQLILMEPYMFCDDTDNPMLVDLDAYIRIVHRLAEEFDAVIVSVHAAYMALKDKRSADQWAEDTVHPCTWAHAWIAKQWLDTVLKTD
jgi:lysophospholipase L1-like esterase